MNYMIVAPYLRDGEYKTAGKLRWHERVRLKMAYWLFYSIPKPYDLEIKTTTGG